MEKLKTVLIHGSERRSSTYHLAHLFVRHLLGEGAGGHPNTGGAHTDAVTEFFLPSALNAFCAGCYQCFEAGEERCPHYAQTAPIARAMDEADVLVFTTPVYVMRASGQMKALLDHFAYRFLVHRPSPRMFTKVGVVLTTAAGGGTKSALKDIATSFAFWGVGHILKCGAAVYASSWEQVSEKRKKELDARLKILAAKARRKLSAQQPGLSAKFLFYFFRIFHRKTRLSELDARHWDENGWTKNERPWKA